MWKIIAGVLESFLFLLVLSFSVSWCYPFFLFFVIHQGFHSLKTVTVQNVSENTVRRAKTKTTITQCPFSEFMACYPGGLIKAYNECVKNSASTLCTDYRELLPSRPSEDKKFAAYYGKLTFIKNCFEKEPSQDFSGRDFGWFIIGLKSKDDCVVNPEDHKEIFVVPISLKKFWTYSVIAVSPMSINKPKLLLVAFDSWATKVK